MAAARLRASVATPDASDPSTRGLGAWLARAAPVAARGEVSIAVVSDRRVRALNRQFRGKDAVTDVLSFPVAKPGLIFARAPGRSNPVLFLGDIVIASGLARRQAKAAGHSVSTEFRVLALHGLLHLLGYDHESDDGRMARAEARLRRKVGLREGLIERS